MIDRTSFVRRMRSRWIDEFGNVSSPALEGTWATLCDTFNGRLDPSPSDRGRWKVANPATGTGKTQGLCLYAAMLATSDSPSGVLIVVRLKEQADELVETINRLAGREVAVGFHSGNRKVSLDAVSSVPCLVITHKAYSLLLDELSGHGGSQRVTWERIGPRPLIVIDESLAGC